MANTKQSGSAAARRERERQQRDAGRSGQGNKARYKGRKDRSGLYMIITVVTLVAAVIVVFIFLSRAPAAQTNTNPLLKATPADPTVLQELTTVPQATWSAINTGSGVVSNLPTAQHGQPVLKGSNGLPEVFYVGGEFCPYCAAERWAMINALSRFGTFSNLSQIQSYEDNISTFSFYGSSYTSQYVDFAPVEVNGNALDSSGQSYVTLQQMTSDQQKNFEQYNSNGSFPFVNMGNQYIGIGASYSPSVLLDSSQKPYSWQTIASSLTNPKSQIAQGILGTANYLTAGICELTNQQPSTVCGVSTIQQIEQALNKTSNIPSHNGGNLGLAPSLVAADLRHAFSLAL